MNDSKPSTDTLPTAGLLRRLGAILYDGLLLLAVLFVAQTPLLALNSGQTPGNPFYLNTVYLLLVSFVFFGWFWTHGGQTLGMRAWKLRLESRRGGPVSWLQAERRFAVALLSWAALGLGFLWQIVDRDRLTWHDRGSDTRLVLTKGRKRA